MERKPFRKILKGERIVLKKMPYTEEQAKLIYKVVNKERKHLLPWLQWVYDTKSSKDTLSFLNMKEGEYKKKESALYGIYLDNKYIGQVELFSIDFIKDSGEIGYWIDSAYGGKGYMSEAVNILENYFFEYGINRICIGADQDNLASIGVIEKNGYNLEGILRQDDFWEEGDGEYRNTVIYSKLYHEWESENE